MLTREQCRPFVWVACLGVITTALNTLIPVLSSGGETWESFRDLVLLVHAPATLLPVVGLALLTFRVSPFAAVVAIVFTLLEKFLELTGQALQIFPPEETLGNVSVRQGVEAVWDQLYFVLWLCNTLAAAAVGWLLLRSTPDRARFAFAAFAWGAAALTLLLLLGPGYGGLNVPMPGAVLFSIVFTGYRVAIAMSLMRSHAMVTSAPAPGR